MVYTKRKIELVLKKEKRNDQWYVDQYNRNRPFCEWIIAYNEIKHKLNNHIKHKKNGN